MKHKKALIFCIISILFICSCFLINNTETSKYLQQNIALHQTERKLDISIPKSANLLLYVDTFSTWSNEGTIYFVFDLTEENITQIAQQEMFLETWSASPIPQHLMQYINSHIANDTMYEIYQQEIPFSSFSGYFKIMNDKDGAIINTMSEQDFFAYRKAHKKLEQIRVGFIDTTDKKLYLLIKYY